MRLLLLCVLSLCLTIPQLASAQTASDPLEISAENAPLLFTFDLTNTTDLYNMPLGSSNGLNGFSSSPTAGQLDADAFAVTGLSDGDVNYGASRSTGDYARGNSTGGVSTGGLYAFDIDNDPTEENFALGVQPTGSDMTSGRLFFCYQNATGVEVTSVNVDYDVSIYNDQPRSTGVAVFYNINASECDAQQSVSGPLVTVTTPAAADISPQWQTEPLAGFLGGVSIQNGEFFSVAIEITDVGGSGGRDEIALDSLSVTFNPDTPIPVELASFDAIPNGRKAALSWSTASETNNSGFEVKHRAPGTTAWRTLGFVEGHGTTRQPQQYRFSTDVLSPGSHSFRLRQVDIDGASTLTKPQDVYIQGNALAVLGPNPMREGQTAEILVQPEASQSLDLAVYDVLGRRVKTVYSGSVSAATPVRASFSTEGLSSGRYFIRAAGGGINQTTTISVVR